jgi:2-hydroxychromene-2-carboxylate isomerase
VTAPVFYFDFNSPYAYLAAERIEEMIPGAEWRPIPFAILLQQLGRLEQVLQRDFPDVLPIVRERAAARLADQDLVARPAPGRRLRRR